MRCACGVYLKQGQRRCRACAVKFLDQYETDAFSKVEPTVMLNPEEQRQWAESESKNGKGETTKRYPPQYPKKWPELEAWEIEYRRRNRVKLLFGMAIIAVVMALACWAVCSH